MLIPNPSHSRPVLSGRFSRSNCTDTSYPSSASTRMGPYTSCSSCRQMEEYEGRVHDLNTHRDTGKDICPSHEGTLQLTLTPWSPNTAIHSCVHVCIQSYVRTIDNIVRPERLCRISMYHQPTATFISKSKSAQKVSTEMRVCNRVYL